MIKTITVSGDTEVKIAHSERFIWMRNLSSEDISASLNSEDFAVIPSGHSLRFENSPEHTIFFRGSGDVELYSSDFPESPYRIAGTSGGGGSSAVLISKNITANGTYNASGDSADGYSSVTVDVSSSVNLQELTVSGTGTYLPDAGYDGFSKVTVQSSDEVLQYATVGFKVYMGDSPWTTSYAGKWLCIDLYIDGEMCLHRSAGVYLEYETDRFDSVTVSSVSADSYSITFKLDITGAFHQDGEGRKTSVTAGSAFYENDAPAPPISTFAQARQAVNAGKYAVVIDV